MTTFSPQNSSMNTGRKLKPLAAMNLRRGRVVGHSCAAVLTHFSTAVTPPAFAAQRLGVNLRRPCRGRRLAGEGQLGRCTADQRKHYRLFFVNFQGSPRGGVPSANSSRWLYLRGGADTCISSCYAACACGTKSRRQPPVALPGAGI